MGPRQDVDTTAGSGRGIAGLCARETLRGSPLGVGLCALALPPWRNTLTVSPGKVSGFPLLCLSLTLYQGQEKWLFKITEILKCKNGNAKGKEHLQHVGMFSEMELNSH